MINTHFTNGIKTTDQCLHEARVYGMPYLDHIGRIIHPLLVKATKRPYSQYMLGDSFGLYTGTAPMETRKLSDSNHATSMEWLLRVRRGIDFSDATGLREVVIPRDDGPENMAYLSMYEELRMLITLDHISHWRSIHGTFFVLTEPFHGWPEVQNKPLTIGHFSCIRVPDDFAPYSGCLLPGPDANPTGRAYLVCRSEAKNELTQIATALARERANVPRWNDITGVQL